MKKLIALAVGVLFICSCGGPSSGENAENKESRIYNIKKEGSLETGHEESWSFKGRDNKGNSYSGSKHSIILGPSFLDDIPVIEEKTIADFSQSGVGLINSISYNYYKENGDNYKSVNQDGSFDLTLVQSSLPDEIKIGDFGPGATTKSSDGKITTSTWQALDGGSGNLKLVFSTKYRNSATNISQATTYFRPDGSFIRETRIIYLDNNLVITLDYTPL